MIHSTSCIRLLISRYSLAVASVEVLITDQSLEVHGLFIFLDIAQLVAGAGSTQPKKRECHCPSTKPQRMCTHGHLQGLGVNGEMLQRNGNDQRALSPQLDFANHLR